MVCFSIIIIIIIIIGQAIRIKSHGAYTTEIMWDHSLAIELIPTVKCSCLIHRYEAGTIAHNNIE